MPSREGRCPPSLLTPSRTAGHRRPRPLGCAPPAPGGLLFSRCTGFAAPSPHPSAALRKPRPCQGLPAHRASARPLPSTHSSPGGSRSPECARLLGGCAIPRRNPCRVCPAARAIPCNAGCGTPWRKGPGPGTERPFRPRHCRCAVHARARHEALVRACVPAWRLSNMPAESHAEGAG